ncbi:MAG TPA: acetate--CoA ligase family protein, partial [Methylomirabilota bacterium]|nr:acetate--CoA ligase family protein [Methylomirabilota bacterium]
LDAGPLSPENARRLLEAYGIAVAPQRLAATPEEAARAAVALGLPVALKAVGRGLVHKSDLGGVRLALDSAEAVLAAAREMSARLSAAADAKLEGFLVQRMVAGEAEVIVGTRRDPTFGPVGLAGLGGVAVEILGDVALAPAPVSRVRAGAMLSALRAAPLLHGARGRPPLDVAAVADAIVRLSWLAADLGDRLVDLEINPLIVGHAGRGAVAVDVRGRLEPARKESSA